MIRFLVLFIFALILFGACSEPTSSSGEKPERPLMVEKKAGDDLLESEPGIDATVEPEDGIRVIWKKPGRYKNIVKYTIYRSVTTPSAFYFQKIGDVNTTTNHDTLYIDRLSALESSIKLNEKYFYYITAVSEEGAISSPSDTVQYTLIDKADNLKLVEGSQITNPQQLTFTATYPNVTSFGGTHYILRIRTEDNFTVSGYKLVYTIKKDLNYEGTIEEVISDNTQLKSLFKTNTRYEWRIDLMENLYSGSETDWQEFTIIWGDE